MGERKRWKKRIASAVLAAAMVVTQVGVWNYGKESVDAAENIIYADDMESEVETGWNIIWKQESDTSTEQRKIDEWASNNKTQWWAFKSATENTVTITRNVSVEAGRYLLLVDADGGKIDGQLSLIVENQKISKDMQFGEWDQFITNKTDEIILDDKSDITIQCTVNMQAEGWFDLDNLSLQKVEENENQNTYETKKLYFKYSGNQTPAIMFWDKNGESLQPEDSAAKVEVESKFCYPMEKASGENWYQIDLKYIADSIKNQDVGFDIVEITSDNTSKKWLKSYDYYWKNSPDAYVKIFDNTYTDPAIIQDEYDNVVSYAQALSDEESAQVVTDASIAVKRVKDLPSDFIMGMDISSVISEFASGVTYKDFDGKIIDNVTDFCKFLASQGITCIRVRVWNNPYDASGNGYGGGNNDVEKAKTMADACRAAGIKMLVDFHCSDLWTDPGKQQVPKAWKNYSLEEKESALQQFLKDSLNTIDPAKDTVTMVQVGNETTNGFIGETDITNMCKLFSAGAAGVRAYNGEVKVVIHETNPEKGNVTKWAKNLSDNSVNYDVLATSYYPYWHGTLDNLKSEFAKVKADYGKDVMVAETSYAYTLNDSDGHDNTVRVGNNDTGENTTEPFNEQGQATAIRNLIEAVNSVGGLGVFYWEPAWITVGDTTGLTGAAYEEQVAKNKAVWEKYGSGWASSFANEYDSEDAGKWYGGSAVDNEAMFYPDGTPTPGLHVWNYVKTGSKTNDVYLYSVGKAEELNQTIKVGENADIPETVTVTYSTGEVQEPVTWNAEELGKIDQNKPGVYEVSGVVNLTKEITQGLNKGQKQAEVTYKLTVKQANLITDAEDAGFEKGENFEVSGSGISDIPAKDDPYEGSYSMHWFAKDAAAVGTVTYNKEITLESGKYHFETVAQGAGAKISLNILDQSGKVLFEGEQMELNGWKNWMIPQVHFSLSQKTAVKLQIQVDMAAGGWGTADSLYLYKTGEVEKPDSGNGGNGGSGGGIYIPTTPTTPTTPTIPTTPETPSTGDTTITENLDGTTTETKTETTTNESGKEVEVTVTTEKDADGNVTGSREVSVIAEAGKNTSATVTVAKDADGKVTDVKAKVTQTGTGSKTNVTTTISGDVVSQIVKAAAADSVAIKVTVTDSKGNTKYTVSADSQDVTAGNKLKIVAVDKKTGKYKLVNANTYQVAEDGSVKVSLPKGADYALLSTKEAKTVEKAILKTVAPKKSTASVKKGKSTKLQMSSKLDMDNVKNITYSTSKKSVASISKSGKITAKKKGTVVVKAKVTLKNGTTKTVSMKIKVK